MSSRARVDQLACDAYLVTALAYGTFEHVTDPQLASDLLHVDRLPLVSEARIASDDEQPATTGECGKNFLDHAVGEILLLRIARHILEGQNRDRRLVG